MMMMSTMTLARVNLRARTTSLEGEDSCCRGGIVHTRGGFSCVRSIRPESSKALWRFRASTSNSSSGRSWPQTYTPMCYIDHTCAQQDIRVYEDDHCEPQMRQYSNSKAL